MLSKALISAARHVLRLSLHDAGLNNGQAYEHAGPQNNQHSMPQLMKSLLVALEDAPKLDAVSTLTFPASKATPGQHSFSMQLLHRVMM